MITLLFLASLVSVVAGRHAVPAVKTVLPAAVPRLRRTAAAVLRWPAVHGTHRRPGRPRLLNLTDHLPRRRDTSIWDDLDGEYARRQLEQGELL